MIIKCTFCGTPLNHLALKQVMNDTEGNLLFEVCCINPHCNKENYTSKDGYFRLKNDLISLTQSVPYIKNMKLPSEMTVIFVSMKRCGISWIIKVLNEVHEIMFGVPITFHTEISRLIASRKKFDLPDEWNNVYDIDPLKLIERGYDRVIIVQRDYETMIKVHKLYFNKEWTDYQKKVTMRKTKEHYKLVYEKEINHPRCLRVRLEDLNAYTISIFKELLDFLNFPDIGRPILIPINPPERKWQVYSSILKKGHKVNKRLQDIEKLYKIERV